MAVSVRKRPRLSVVIVALNEAAQLRRTVANVQSTLPPSSEIVVVDDGSDDGCAAFLESQRDVRLIRSPRLGVAGARNLGARHARGDSLVFADAHIRVPPEWWSAALRLLERPGVGAVAPAISDFRDRAQRGFGMRLGGPDMITAWLRKRSDRPYQVPVLPGACFAITRDVFQAVAGFDEGNLRLGGNDQEMSLRLWLLGHRLWVLPSVVVAHAFRRRAPYGIEAEAFVHNRVRIAFCHFGRGRIARVLDALRVYHTFPQGMALAMMSNWKARRDALDRRRLFDDDWFFRKFDVSW